MHKLSTILHKTKLRTKEGHIKSKSNNIITNHNKKEERELFSVSSNKNQIASKENQTELANIQKENRLAQVISLYSKGLSQYEISQQLGVNQSTISRDIQFLQQEAKKKIWKYLNEDILFEYLRYIVGSNEISKNLWEIVQDKNISIKDKNNALSLLNQSYNKRLEILVKGPESFKNVKRVFLILRKSI